MIRVFSNSEELSLAAAEAFCAIARDATAARGRCMVVLAGGSSPRRLYELLATQPYRNRVEWHCVEFFWGDERAVSPDHQDSNFRMAREILLERLAIPQRHIHRIQAERDDRDAAARDYQDEIARAFGVSASGTPPMFDVVLLGMGADGHTASLFPGTEAIAETQRWVVSHHVLALAVARTTMTPRILNAAYYVLFLVAGRDKAETLAQVLEGPRDPQRLPSQMIQPTSGALAWFVDRPAAANLKTAYSSEGQSRDPGR